MKTRLTRRELLKLAALTGGALGSLALDGTVRGRLPSDDQLSLDYLKIVRVGIRQDDIYEAPSLESTIIGHRGRDQLVRVLEEFESDGPPHNPRWYRVVGGFMHTAHLAPVETHYQVPMSRIESTGQAFEVSVPYTRTLRFSEQAGWEPLYRLYYRSNHWAVDVTEGPDGEPWYVLEDDLLHVEYMAKATHLRLIDESEYAPIRPEVLDKRVEVSLRDQTVTCFENGQQIFRTNVSTGIPSLGPTTNGIPTETPKGEFNVSIKTPVRHMGDGRLTSDINAYELPGVPWSTFFTDTGVAFHGTYWHDNFGGRMSHGCVNMRTDEALWLYRWTTPVFKPDPGKWHVNGFGTRIEVF